jgi:D-amino-acid oxidase
VRVLVVGAGAVGLTCAVRLAEAGYDAHVLARDLPAETTSAVAAALWYPYRALPEDAVTSWSARSYAVFAELAASHPESGVRMRSGVELHAGTTPPPDPWWREAVPGLTTVRDPAPGYGYGWRAQLPVADTTTYLDWLVARLAATGGTVTRAWLPDLPSHGVVVNTCGLAARALAGDTSVHPVRGQVVRVEQVGIEEWLLEGSDETRPLYVVPREHDVIVGGTAEVGSWDLRPDPEVGRAVLARAVTLVPALRQARVLGHRVGLRPARPAVRLETVPHADGSPGGIVHCYGHGGAGVTLSWGCADDVLAQVDQLSRIAAGQSPAR